MILDPLNQDTADLADDARRLLMELDRDVPGVAALNAECRPAFDVLETSTAIELVVDVPGVPADSLRVAIRRNTVLVVGAKFAPPSVGTSRFHLAERSYGRFARAIRVAGAFDSSRARAVSGAGELRVILPRLEDRRGRVLRVPVEPA